MLTSQALPPLTLAEIEERIARHWNAMPPEQREAERRQLRTPEELRRRTPSKRALLEALAELDKATQAARIPSSL